MTMILALVLLCAPAFAQEATIEALRGKVSIQGWGSDKSAPAHVGDELISGDTIKTGPGATLHLRMAVGGAMLLRENTQLTIGGDADHARLEIPFGEFLAGLKR